MIIVLTADVFSMVSCTCGMMDEPEIKDINMKQYRMWRALYRSTEIAKSYRRPNVNDVH